MTLDRSDLYKPLEAVDGDIPMVLLVAALWLLGFHVTFLNMLLVARAPGVSPYMLHVQRILNRIACN